MDCSVGGMALPQNCCKRNGVISLLFLFHDMGQERERERVSVCACLHNENKKQSMMFCSVAIVLLLSAQMCAAAGGSFKSTIQAPFAWEYEGALGPSEWWPLGFDTCDLTSHPNQSPINIATASVVGPTVPIVVKPVHEAIRSLSVIMHPETTNVLRAETWPSQELVHILMNGELESNRTQYVFHHIAVHFPSQNTVDGVAAEGELSFVFFPFAAGRPYSEYAVGGINFVLPFVGSSLVGEARFDRTLRSFTYAKTTGVAEMIFDLPTFGPSAVYNGSLPFPPCVENMTTVVSMTNLVLSAHTVEVLHAASPQGIRRREVVPLGTRVVRTATVAWDRIFLTPPTEAEIRARPPRYVITTPLLDVTTSAYGYGALCVGMLCVLLVCCILVQLYERWTFVSTTRDTWVNPITQAATFGCAPISSSDEDEDEEGSEEYEEGDDEGEL